MGNKLSCVPCVPREDTHEEVYSKPEQAAGDEGNTVRKEGPEIDTSNKSCTNGNVGPHENRNQSSNDQKSKKRREVTESESSDSSSDPDSSDQNRYQKSSTKAYKNRPGGTILVNKKVIVSGNYTKIYGDGAQNIVLTVNNNSKPSQPRKQHEVKNTGSRYEPYTERTKKDFTSWRKNSDSACGNFIYLSEASKFRLEGADVLELKRMWMDSVCRIQYRNKLGEVCNGSGFRIGHPTRKYLCTASHVVREIVNSQVQSIFNSASSSMNEAAILESRLVFCVFNHNTDDYIPHDRDKFYFKGVIHFENAQTDIAILELMDNEFGTNMPQPFTKFTTPDPTFSFHLIGHPGGGKKMTCKSENIINTQCPATANHINIVRRWCANNRYACEPSADHTLDNPARWLFHIAEGFTKGASGCPGLVITPPYDVSVVTVFLRGYPDGYYDRTMSPDVKYLVPKEYLVEQGANMEFVARKMYNENPNLYSEIFNIQ